MHFRESRAGYLQGVSTHALRPATSKPASALLVAQSVEVFHSEIPLRGNKTARTARTSTSWIQKASTPTTSLAKIAATTKGTPIRTARTSSRPTSGRALVGCSSRSIDGCTEPSARPSVTYTPGPPRRK